jgi:DNA-binding NarL/FixJ family response regulator
MFAMTTMTKSVLLVDDSPLIRRCLHRVFDSEVEFAVCGEAANGREAIEKAEALHPDLIVLDLSMPEMNGLEAARRLSKVLPSARLILLSSYTEVLPAEAARSAGFSAVFSKAQNIAKLVDRARDVLRMS